MTKENETKSLDEQVNFSWERVMKRGVQNMKDDVDPVYKGSKMGFYALHGIPTWVRESRDGKLSCDSHGWAILSGLFVGGGCATAYILGGLSFPPILAVPVVAQGLSYVRESFRRARKTELENVVLTKVQRSLNGQSEGEFNLNCQEMISTLANKLYEENKLQIQESEENIKEYINSLGEDLKVVETATDLNSIQKQQQTKIIKSKISRNKKQLDELNDSLKTCKEQSLTEAKEGLVYLSRDIFNGLFADNKVGQDYEMDVNSLDVGPKKRKKDYARKFHFRETPHLDESSIIADLIKNVVQENSGIANIELFGKVTAVYSSKQNKESHYLVKPNELWEK